MQHQRIVVGVDGSDGAGRALRWAVDEAARRAAVVEAVYAWNPAFAAPYPYALPQYDLEAEREAAEKLVHDAVASVDAGGLASPVEPVLVTGGVVQALLTQARGADLLVVGSRGRGGFAGLLLGSVSQQVAAHAGCPVVVVPAHPDHTTGPG